MKKGINVFIEYYKSFQGDTYDACAHCGGKCEKFKISALIPGEKEYIATRLGKTLSEFKKGFLSIINTPYGNIDVLKLKDNCPFLDKKFKCTAILAKPFSVVLIPLFSHCQRKKANFIHLKFLPY